MDTNLRCKSDIESRGLVAARENSPVALLDWSLARLEERETELNGHSGPTLRTRERVHGAAGRRRCRDGSARPSCMLGPGRPPERRSRIPP